LTSFALKTSDAGEVGYTYSETITPYWPFSATFPDATVLNDYGTGNGYGFINKWFGSPSYYDSSVTSYQNWVNFQRIKDYFKIEIADTDIAWVASGITADLNLNESTDITWASSTSVAASAAIIFATLATL